MTRQDITIAGAGVLGLWQALVLGRAGHKVTVFEQAETPFATAASRWAGAMLAPDCEAEAAPDLVRDLGRKSISHWRTVLPKLALNGTLVVANARDSSELSRFARVTERHRTLTSEEIARLEPDLDQRFASALFYPEEAHFDCLAGLRALVAAARGAGAEIAFGVALPGHVNGLLVDCRGLAARDDVAGLRGVRGERLILQSREVRLSRPVRLLHPRQPIYVVPQGDGRYVVGATVIEREDEAPVTARSALELLGSAYALHPAFAEAEIVDMGAGVRPAFVDNVPRVLIEHDGRTIRVNGAYRHGFLLAPILAEAVEAYVAGGRSDHPLMAQGASV